VDENLEELLEENSCQIFDFKIGPIGYTFWGRREA